MARRLPEALYRAALFALPFALAFVYVASLLAVLPPEEWSIIFVLGMATYLLTPVGVGVAVALVVVTLQGVGAAWYAFVIAAASIVLVDVFTALFFLWNWDLVERVPRLGALVRRVEDRCRKVIERRRWGEGASLTTLAVYVALPFYMTGGLVGSILGRMLGLGRVRVFLTVAAGRTAGVTAMALLAYFAGKPVLDALRSPTVASVGFAAGILITVAFVGGVVFLYLRGRRRAN